MRDESVECSDDLQQQQLQQQPWFMSDVSISAILAYTPCNNIIYSTSSSICLFINIKSVFISLTNSA